MPSSDITIVDGTMDFSRGVNSIKPTTIASEANPGGLRRNELAWMVNCTARDGGISPRAGWKHRKRVNEPTVLSQGGKVYQPRSANPYLIAAFSGRIYQILLEFPYTVTDLSTISGLTLPATEPFYHFEQAEEFMLIQAGDYVTLPLFWDGVTLRQSIGITNTAVAPGTPGVNEIPAAGPMRYYQGRLWYAQGRQYSAGDIVGGASGTIAYNFRDAVLNVTENPLVLTGDGFTVPDNSGNIRALDYNANLDTALGQGRLFPFTAKTIYALNVPTTRTDWINADSTNQPQQTIVQLVNGAVGDRCVVAVAGDLFYQSLEPGISSLISALRDFNQWSNRSLSANENRVLQFVDRALLRFASGIVFDNRLLQTTLPEQRPQGVIHKALIPLDFMPTSSFGERAEPVWGGINQGLDMLQLFVANFGGLERAYTLVVSEEDSSINLWEITQRERTEDVDKRIEWLIETPSFNWDTPFDLKKLVSAEFWVDRLWGTADFTLEYRPDGQTCWTPWHRWQACSARNPSEFTGEDSGYPEEEFGDGYQQTMTMPAPPEGCASATGRPTYIGYQFQIRLTIKGYCRLRGFLLHAEPRSRKLYDNMQCTSPIGLALGQIP